MKLRLTFKTPDVMFQAAEQIAKTYGVDEEEDTDASFNCDCDGGCIDCERIMDDQKEVKDFLTKFIKCGEVITIEFDTVEKTFQIYLLERDIAFWSGNIAHCFMPLLLLRGKRRTRKTIS